MMDDDGHAWVRFGQGGLACMHDTELVWVVAVQMCRVQAVAVRRRRVWAVDVRRRRVQAVAVRN